VHAAVVRRWNVRDEHRARLPDILFAVASDTSAPFQARVMSAKALVACEAQNQADDRMALENERPQAPGALHLHAHQHTHGADSRLDERLRELDALLAQERARNQAEPAALPAPAAPTAPEYPPPV
jgi:hypothetical protein